MKVTDHLMAKNRSIGNRIIIPVNLFIAIFLIVVGYVQVRNQAIVLKNGADVKVDSVASALEVLASVAIKNQDKISLAKVTTQLVQDHVVDGIVFLDSTGSVFYESSPKGEVPNRAQISRDLFNEEGTVIGRMDLAYNYNGALFEARQSIAVVIAVVLGIQVLMSILILLLVRRIVQPLNRMRHQLEKGTTVNEETSLTLKSSAEQLSSSSAAQASSVQESVSAMAEMKSMISQTAGHVNECQRMSETVRDRTQDGSRIMGDMASSMESIEGSNQQLAGLVEIIGEIRNKTKIINDIVFKTQLLSFNASIEAARAGQHGRGFAVVAEEVGNLAQMSGKASKEIESLLVNSHQQVHGMIDDVQKKVKEGKEVTEEALGTFNNISQQILSISEKIRQIGDATKEQELGVEETSKSMTELDRTAQNNNQAARNMSALAEKAKVQGEELRKIAQGLQTLVVGKKGLRDLGKTPFRNKDYWGDKKDEIDPGALPSKAQSGGDMLSLVDRILVRHKGKTKPQVGTKEDQVGRLDRKVVSMSGVNADDESFKKKKAK